MVAASGQSPQNRSGAGMAESRAEITDDVTKLVAVVAADVNDLVVGVFQVPVVDQRHHDLQSLKLRSAGKWIAFPLPLRQPVPAFRPRFKPGVGKRSFTGNRDARHEIIDFGEIADAPKQSDR